jgi:epoxyqueuosine reductase
MLPAQPFLDLARGAGFSIAGIADARPSDHAEALRRWIAEGQHGSMAWLADDLEVRIDPGRLLPGVRSVLCVADRYAAPSPERRAASWPPRGRIARYARGQDYHVVMRDKLRALAKELRRRHPGEEFRIACDLLPVLERELAARAGIGLVGKHTLVIEPGGGSWILLGEVLTTVPIERTPRPGRSDPCGACTLCIEACPTEAITPFAVNASRCLAYTTIEHRGRIDPELLAPTDDWLFGCDLCQEVCPHNGPSRRKRRRPIDPRYAERMSSLDLLEILGWTEEDRLQATLRSAVRRAELEMLKRNAIICLGNALAKSGGASVDRAVVARLEAIAGGAEESALVRSTAADVLARLGDGYAFSAPA